MPHPLLGLLFVGFIVKTLIAAIFIVAMLWLIFKLGKLADVYREKLRPK